MSRISWPLERYECLAQINEVLCQNSLHRTSYTMKACKVGKASAAIHGGQVCPKLNTRKRACLQQEINSEMSELRTSSSAKRRFVCISSSHAMASHEYVGGKRAKDADYKRESADDACQDLRLAFSMTNESCNDQKLCMNTTHPSVVESLFSPVCHMPNGEASANCTIGVDDSEDDDKRIDIVDNTQDNNSTASEENYKTSSAFYPSLDVFRDTSMFRVYADATATVQDSLTNTASLPEDEFIQSQSFDAAESCIVWPLVDENATSDDTYDTVSIEEDLLNSDGACLFLAMQQTKSLEYGGKDDNDSGTSDELDDFDPYLFIKSLPDLSEVVSPYRPMLLPKQARRRPPITLVLDLDETLVHSTLDHCNDADFTFPVHFNMKEHTIYVRRRPFLQMFMERVAQMFEVIVFTASQSIYAEQLLNKLDPKQKLIHQRVYRESCVLVDGNYTKDLTILGRDLSKIAIIDNSPLAFGLQVDNGIPIESWFDDRSDSALVSLLPFLETLVGVDDVRPIIATKFNLRQKAKGICMEPSSLEHNREMC
ncbi:phosphatase PSR1 isoform X1 [Cryptomeria japonica]|uniref:phosphatase PSR1 isoform X1 n=2 Tax=Cryptomeria japonica TaxID=3369 RepID=UPI0027DA42DD|nr:phosphatase PSR1 isoform X1 [Cryptomeria japonica]